MAMDLDAFLARLEGVHHHPLGITARCPVPEHDDHVNSLTVGPGRHGGIVYHCQKDCSQERVLEAMGLTGADVMGLPYKVCDYPYTDLNGAVLYTMERWANPKTFRGYLPPPSGRVLYNWPAVPWAKQRGLTVLWVEGEDDVDSCSARGIPAVTACGGAGPGKLLPQYYEALDGVNVAVVVDNDQVGKEYGREKVRGLEGHAASVQLLHTKVGKDITDAFEAGYDLDVLEPLQESEDVGSYLAAHVQPRKLTWAWKNFFALGKIGLIEGDPGDGKSIMTIDLAARWSNGMKLPDGSNGMGPSSVLLVSAEDDLEDTLLPRIIAAGGDRSKIHLMVHGITPDVPFTFSEGLQSVYRAVVRHGIKIIIFDPLMAFLGGETDSHNDASVRRALQPLKLLASNTGCAVLLVRHLNKGGSGSKAIYRGGGSIAFTGAARSTFLVTPAEDDVTRVMSCVKNNLARKPDSLTYTVEVSPDDVPYIRWGEPIKLTAQEALDGHGRRGDSEANEDRRSKKKVRILAGEFLLDVLSGGPKTWAEIVEEAKEEGFSKMTLERARAEVGLTKLTGQGGNATTRWARPEVPPSPPEQPHFLTSSPGQVVSLTSPRADEVTKWEPDKALVDETGSDLTEEERRDDALMATPLACDVCGTETNVLRWFEPFWVIRCPPHNPRKYGGGNGKEKASGNTHD